MSSFMDIKNPIERDAIIKDYLATIRSIQQQNEDDRTIGLSRQRELEKHFHPVAQSQNRMTEEITRNLKPIRQKVEKLNNYVKEEVPDEKLPGGDDDDGGPRRHFRRFKAKVLSQDPDVDTSFGIRFLDDGRTAMGNKVVTIDEYDEIHVENEIYYGTKGL